MMMIELITQSEDETRRVARQLAARLRCGDVIALEGPLGAGKTCFVRGLAEGLGLDARDVSSPTFLLCQLYERHVGRGGTISLAHLDGYRLSSPEELETIGFDELLTATDIVIAIEWADRFGQALPDRRIAVRMAHVDERSRRIVIAAPKVLTDRLTGLSV